MDTPITPFTSSDDPRKARVSKPAATEASKPALVDDDKTETATPSHGAQTPMGQQMPGFVKTKILKTAAPTEQVKASPPRRKIPANDFLPINPDAPTIEDLEKLAEAAKAKRAEKKNETEAEPDFSAEFIDDDMSSSVKARNSAGELVKVFSKDDNYAPLQRLIYEPRLSRDKKSIELYYPMEGRDHEVFASISIDDPSQVTILAEDPNHDIRRVLRDPKTDEPLAYAYLDTEGDLSVKWKAIKPEMEKKLQEIDELIIKEEGSRKSTEAIHINEDGTWDVFVHYSDTPDTKYTLTHSEEKGFQVKNIARANEKLSPKDLAQSQALRLMGAKGKELTALLTLPPGVESAKGLPVVVMPHGGPESHFYQRYDENVQFLANRGFAVLQLNHSGSTGHGRELIEDIHQNFQLAAKDTITMTQDAISQGLIDSKEVYSLGHSFGAYTVAKANELEPGLFKKSIVYNGPIMPWAELGKYMITTDRIENTEEDKVHRKKHQDLIAAVTNPDGSDDIDFSKITTPTSFMFSSSDNNIFVPKYSELESHLSTMPGYREMNEFANQPHVFIQQSAAAAFLERTAEFFSSELPDHGKTEKPKVEPSKKEASTYDQGFKDQWRAR